MIYACIVYNENMDVNLEVLQSKVYFSATSQEK